MILEGKISLVISSHLGQQHMSLVFFTCGRTLVGKNIFFFCSFSVIIFIEIRIYMGNTL
jgi:hypothetical protein